MSFDSYLSSVYADVYTYGSYDKDNSNAYIRRSIFNFKSMWDITVVAPAIAAQIGHNSGDKDDYMYFAPWDNSITSITYKIMSPSTG